MADDDRETPVNGDDNPKPGDFFDAARNGGEEARVNELRQKLKSLEIEKSDLVRDNGECKKKIESLKAEIESLRKQDAVLREKIEAEIVLFEDGQKALESARKRSVELETEVSRLHQDLNNTMDEVDEAKKEAAELKKLMEEKDGRVVGLEKEIKDLKSRKIESETRIRDLEWQILIFQVKEGEKLMIERELRDKNVETVEMEGEIDELKETVENMMRVIKRETRESAKREKEKRRVEEILRAWKKKAKEMEFKVSGLKVELEQSEKIISELKEKMIHADANGKRELDDDTFKEPIS